MNTLYYPIQTKQVCVANNGDILTLLSLTFQNIISYTYHLCVESANKHLKPTNKKEKILKYLFHFTRNNCIQM